MKAGDALSSVSQAQEDSAQTPVAYESPAAVDRIELASDAVRIVWENGDDGWHVASLSAKGADWTQVESASGLHTVLHVDRKPAQNLVELDKEGSAYPFYPSSAERRPDGTVVLRSGLSVGEMVSEWSIDPHYPTDIRVRIRFTASVKGYVSIPSPTLVTIDPIDLAWGMVPGNWYGTAIARDLELSPGYSQGLPNRPCLARERNTMTLCPLVSTKSGITIGVIPDPGTAADPWENDRSTRDTWKLGLSTMDRYGQITPVLYHPVMGEAGSLLQPGESVSFGFRYCVKSSHWFDVFRHAAEDVYEFRSLLDQQKSREPLVERVWRLSELLKDDANCGWKVQQSAGLTIGSNGTKTSDVGAMCMLARATDDPILRSRLPLIRNFKLAQQQTRGGFFQHAATGEYPFEDDFAAERGNWIEPLFTTYYTLLDMGNLALFDPDDAVLRERIRLACEKLLRWQHRDGSWEVAYDRVSHLSAFPHLHDLRPTWYGLFVGARVLGDERFLAAARNGADWYIENAVKRGCYLGACGDALNIWDFTTAFGSQALLDLYHHTGCESYKEAAIEVARVYATSIFTHPIASDSLKTIGDQQRRDWEMTQVGLSVEHIRGTGNSGPVLLSSHAGLFVRMHELTGEQIFLDMARASARGRHHFADPETGMAVYYWSAIDMVAKKWKLFPWHAEWQVGWITDYLLAEAKLRSDGAIAFPSGFPTPKVGPHVTYGFAAGHVYGRKASLRLGGPAIRSEHPDVELLVFLQSDGTTLLLVALNQSGVEQSPTFRVGPTRVATGQSVNWTSADPLGGTACTADATDSTLRMQLRPWGIGAVALKTDR